MTMLGLPRRNLQWLESVLALAVLAGFIHMAYQTISLGYFPQPFFWDLDDTFRDWFSTALWAHHEGAYDVWLTVYPPLSFVFLKAVSLQSCYDVDITDKVARQCDWIGIVAIHVIYVINAILTSIAFIKLDRKTALQRSFALTAGLPMLFGLERGNLILLCFTCILLGYGPLLRSAKLRWLFIGIAVNLKVYIIAGVLVQLVRRRWLWVEASVISIVAVYLISYGIFGAGTPIEIYNNLVNFGTGSTPNQILDFWYANTYNALYYVITKSDAPVNYVLDSSHIQFVTIAIPLVTHCAQLLIILALIATWLRPEVVPPFRVTFLGLALAMITSEYSPYTQPILLFFAFMERWEGWARPLAIGTCYILCIPFEYVIAAGPTVQFSYIAGRWVNAEQGIAVGMFVRPFVFMLPAYFLSLLTIKDVWNDVRHQGWSQRRRFRNDWPLLPGITHPTEPTVDASSIKVTK